MSTFSELVGATLVAIEGLERGSDCATFIVSDGSRWKMYHIQDCCESVLIEDVCGDVADLIGSPIVQADERDNEESGERGALSEDESHTWTFYRIATIKGMVVIRWYGASNGYYSESVDFERISEAA